MATADYFFLVFVVTILLTRFFLSFRQIESPTIRGFRLHHYMHGLVFIVLAYVISSVTLYAVGLALFVDEIPQFISNRWSWEGYFSRVNLTGLVFITAFVYIFREYFIARI